MGDSEKISKLVNNVPKRVYLHAGQQRPICGPQIQGKVIPVCQQRPPTITSRDQLRRAAVSVASNIAEGKERETVSEFIRFLYIVKGSAGELRTLGYLEKEEFEDFRGRVEKVGEVIVNLARVLRRGQ